MMREIIKIINNLRLAWTTILAVVLMVFMRDTLGWEIWPSVAACIIVLVPLGYLYFSWSSRYLSKKFSIQPRNSDDEL